MATRAIEWAEDAPREWFSARELAELALPGLPGDVRALNRRIEEERWTARTGPDRALLVRPRRGRGGGVEYHLSLLPGEARLALERRGITAPAPKAAEVDRGGWRWFDAQSAKVKAEAERRLDAVRQVELLHAAGATRSAAVSDVADQIGVSVATIWNWLGLVDGVPAADRLPALAPRRRGGGKAAEIDADLWLIYKSDALRQSKPTLTSCYERTARIAAERGAVLPSEGTMRRRLMAEVPDAIWTLRREGAEALRRSIPPQRRTVEHMHAMEAVNIDGHKFDVFVTPPGGGKPIRPMMVTIQDIRSSKIVAWRLGVAESAALARLAVADMIRDYGIPARMTCDNGRAFASKLFSGGAENRYRFKVLDDEPTGLLVSLGIDINWALPYRGQSKPIERAFRDLANDISKAPLCEGAYTGPHSQAKPENYASKAVPWDDFAAHVAREINYHNARLGRTGRDYNKRSFDQVFAETWTEIGRATPEQLRLALLTADQVRVNRQTSEIALYGNRYWAEALAEWRGEKMIVRYDPDRLHDAVYVYSRTGQFVAEAPIIADTGWGDREGAESAAKRLADYRKRARAGVEAEQLIAAEALARMQAELDPAPPVAAEPPKVTRIHRHRGQVAAQLKPMAETIADDTARREARIHAALRLVTDD